MKLIPRACSSGIRDISSYKKLCDEMVSTNWLLTLMCMFNIHAKKILLTEDLFIKKVLEDLWFSCQKNIDASFGTRYKKYGLLSLYLFSILH